MILCCEKSSFPAFLLASFILQKQSDISNFEKFFPYDKQMLLHKLVSENAVGKTFLDEKKESSKNF